MDGITADNIITHPSSPRNKLIAETLQSLRYVQRTGQGVDIIYKDMIKEYLMRNNVINNGTVRELCGFTKQQARTTLSKMMDEDLIIKTGNGRATKYILK